MDSDALNKIENFFSKYPLRQYNKGQILIHAGENPSGIFYIVNGSVRKYDIDEGGQEIVMNIFKPNIFFPITWAINRTQNRYFFEAASTITVAKAPIEDVVDFLKSEPDIILGLLKQVYAGLEDTQRRVVHLMSGDSRSRLLFELVIEARRSGEVQEDGSCLVFVGANELSQRAGLSRETISRELARLLQPDGLLARQGRAIVILNLRKLEDELGEML